MIKPVKPDSDKTILTAAEACGYVGLSWNSLKKLIRSGEIRAVRVGKRYLISKQAIDEFINHADYVAKVVARR